MALSDLLPPAFKSTPDQPPLVLSPASVERRRRVAEAMMKQGMDYSPIQSPWQGVARVTNAIMGGLDERRADDIERAGLASQRDADASMYGGLTGGSGGVPITGALGGAGGGAAPVANGPQGAAGAANYADGKTAAAGLIKGFEGYRDKPYWDTNAYRTGYGSDTVTNPDGTVVPVRQGMQITRDQADADLTRRIGEFQGGIVKTVGPDAWGKLPPAAQGALTSVAYNYGHLPGEVARAVQTGDPHAIAAAVGGLSANPKRRAQEAQAILTGWGAAPQAAPQVASNDPDITGSVTPPPGPGASLSPQDMATLAARYGGGTPPAAAGITDAPVANNPPPAGASGPLSPAAARPLDPGTITDAPLPAGVLPGASPMGPITAPTHPAYGPNGLPRATNQGLINQGIPPFQFVQPDASPAPTGALPPTAPAPVANPSGPPQQPPLPPVTVAAAPAPQDPRAAMVAALQGPPKDSQVQMMIARGINPANPQVPVSPARASMLAALSGAVPAPPQAAQSPAAAQVTGALAAPATVPASAPPYPGQPAPVADAGGNPAQLAAAIKTMSNPWAPEGSRQMAKTIIDRELQARDPLRRMQMLKLQQDMQGGTPDEIKQRQLAIQKTEQEINSPLIVGGVALDRKTMKPLWQPPEKPTTVTPGDTAIDNTGKVIFQGQGYKPQEVSEMRKEIQQLPSYKQYTAALPSWQSMVDAAKRPTAASDLNLVYGIAKIMDPTSVVREGEIQMADGTQGVFGRLNGLINGLNGGNKLQADARAALLAEAQSRMNGFKTSMDADMKGYGTVIKHRGMNPEDVLPNLPDMAPWVPEAIAPEAPPPSTVLPGPAAPMPPQPVVPVPQGAPPAPTKGDMVPQPEAAPVAPPPPPAPTAPAFAPIKGHDGNLYVPNPDYQGNEANGAQKFFPVLTDPAQVSKLPPGSVFYTPDGRRKVSH